MSQNYHFRSDNTQFYIISTNDDAAGQVITTKDGRSGIPDNSIITVDPSIGDSHKPVAVTITGVNGLYVALKGSGPGTKLTWSDEKYEWTIRLTHAHSQSYYITPTSGEDLYWFDEFGIGSVVIVHPGASIQPPQGEWTLIQA